ncbi:MAG: Rieske 2Fe-2S domain-containing protein, partial [Planctomycetes bacterium]|nr:Rieske 2Fe-2S domain-containing protein [Planctomycetota bacterium]
VVTPSLVNPIASAKRFLSEKLDVARHFVGDRLSLQTIESLALVAPGEGRVVKHDGRRLAVFRTVEGVTHCFDPTCTHAGCIVHWNAAEKTWDCPCHGGRFTCLGERLYGPPPADLKRQPVQETTDEDG